MSWQLAPLAFLREVDVWQALGILAKTLTYGASFMAAGGVLFLLLFSRRLSADESGLLKRTIRWAAIAALLFSLLRLSLISAMMSGDASGMVDVAMIKMVIESSEGPATGVRVLGLSCIAILVARRRLAALGRVIALACALVAVCSFALVGHSREIAMSPQIKWVPQLLIGLHLTAVAFWLGALWPLHRLTYGQDLRTTAEISHRFGQYAMTVVGLLVLCGLGLLWLILGVPSALWTSQYGVIFLVKLLGVGALLGLAAVNKFIFTPRLSADPCSARGLRLSIRFEMLMAVLILLTTAVLTTAVGPDTNS